VLADSVKASHPVADSSIRNELLAFRVAAHLLALIGPRGKRRRNSLPAFQGDSLVKKNGNRLIGHDHYSLEK